MNGCALTPLKSEQNTSEQSSNSGDGDATTAENDDDTDPKLPIAMPSEMDDAESLSFEQTIQKATLEKYDLAETDTQRLKNFVHAPNTEENDNLWEVLSHNFFLAPAHAEEYKSYIEYYLKRRKYLKRVSIRAKPYLYYILQEIKKRKMPYEIALLPVIESGYYPFARSYVSASGLWQFMPSTGHLYGLQHNWWYDGRQDIYKSTQAALDYLQQLYVMNDYDWLLALASYNAGLGNVLKAQRKYLKRHPNGTPNFWNIRRYLPQETKRYVPQLLAIAYLIDHQSEYNIHLVPIENAPYFDDLKLTQQINLRNVAKATQTDLQLLKVLNPGFLRVATPPNAKHRLLLPADIANDFRKQYEDNPEKFKVNWARHIIKPGESLLVIAHKYHTSASEIKKLNGLHNNLIRAGHTLLIPIPKNQINAVRLAENKKKPYRGNKYYHTVRPGESLWTIARYYNVSTRTLCEWNRISIRTPLRKGQKLEIRSSKYGKKFTYTLKKGESLWIVAQKYSVTTTELCNWNGLRKSQVVQPGTKLDVWVKS
ncbi:LysM peptidoglycan-binding domain-containing protein [Hydrogenovibrio sp. JE_KL2]|uniref:LysM peptidoglycan-binding domain-containing protein n=1 Tax=Hydrogenovibrio sp. JE_KL2 TaxID=2651188 RepID=UPI0020A31812|nr:LysM peptidoglycan-binding domain-containing protein [Hydrogenovibrio sp. JE_KL2]